MTDAIFLSALGSIRYCVTDFGRGHALGLAHENADAWQYEYLSNVALARARGVSA